LPKASRFIDFERGDLRTRRASKVNRKDRKNLEENINALRSSWLDFLDQLAVPNKAVDQILPIHQAQLLTYLKLSGCPLGFLLNWKVKRIKDGIQRMVWRQI